MDAAVRALNDPSRAGALQEAVQGLDRVLHERKGPMTTARRCAIRGALPHAAEQQPAVELFGIASDLKSARPTPPRAAARLGGPRR
jgi:hypothetical protein